MAEATFVLHGWLRSGNCTAARGAVEFLKEALARLYREEGPPAAQDSPPALAAKISRCRLVPGKLPLEV